MMITLLLLSSFVDARGHHGKRRPKMTMFQRMNAARHAAANKMREEAAKLNAERHAAADRIRAAAAEANRRRHAAAAALRGE
jgi:hypothetical protein